MDEITSYDYIIERNWYGAFSGGIAPLPPDELEMDDLLIHNLTDIIKQELIEK